MTELTINRVPSLTWHFLKMNDARVKWQDSCGAAAVSAAGADDIYRENNGSGDYFPTDDIQAIFDNSEYAAVSVSADENEEKTARVSFDDEGESRSAALCINAARGSRVTVFVTLSGSACLAFRSKTYADEDSYVRIVLTQLTSEQGRLITDSDAFVGKNAELTVQRFCPGTAAAYVQSRVLLSGDESRLISRTSYLGEKTQRLDINLVSAHIGKRTSCDISANGVLNDSSSKTFRGTIDFRCGSSGSVGTEVENVLLLGDEIENKTLPVILCDEEDVSGNHGATIGKISEETLLYFASRGISQELAQRLMAASISDAFCRMIDDEETAAQIRLRTEGSGDE